MRTEFASMTIEAIVDLVRQKNYLLSQDVERFVRFVSFGGGVLQANLNAGAPRDIIKNMNSLFDASRIAIVVKKSDEMGEASLSEQKTAMFEAQANMASSNPIVAEILRAFPNSSIAKVEELA